LPRRRWPPSSVGTSSLDRSALYSHTRWPSASAGRERVETSVPFANADGAILQAAQLATEADVIKLRNARLANTIDLHLALGGSFDTAPAASPVAPQIAPARAP